MTFSRILSLTPPTHRLWAFSSSPGCLWMTPKYRAWYVNFESLSYTFFHPWGRSTSGRITSWTCFLADCVHRDIDDNDDEDGLFWASGPCSTGDDVDWDVFPVVFTLSLVSIWSLSSSSLLISLSSSPSKFVSCYPSGVDLLGLSSLPLVDTSRKKKSLLSPSVCVNFSKISLVRILSSLGRFLLWYSLAILHICLNCYFHLLTLIYTFGIHK